MESNSTAIEGRSSAPCSPSSTPQTSKAWDDVSRTPDGMYDTRVNIREYAYAMLDHSRKMERERNAALDALGKIESLYVDGDDTYEAWKAMGEIAATFLAENSRALAQPGRKNSTEENQ